MRVNNFKIGMILTEDKTTAPIFFFNEEQDLRDQ